jgi:hypothetical protein
VRKRDGMMRVSGLDHGIFCEDGKRYIFMSELQKKVQRGILFRIFPDWRRSVRG